MVEMTSQWRPCHARFCTDQAAILTFRGKHRLAILIRQALLQIGKAGDRLIVKLDNHKG